MTKTILLILTASSFGLFAQAGEPYTFTGKTLFAVNMANKTCNEIVFGLDQKFKLQTDEVGVIRGSYEYVSGLLTMRTAEVPLFQKAKFQKFNENDGKLAVLMENLIDKGVVNMYGNQKFCGAVNMRLVRLSEVQTTGAVVEKPTPIEKNSLPEKIEIIAHDTLKERLDIGPNLTMGKSYQVHSLYVKLYDGLCVPKLHYGGKILCGKTETLIKNIDFELTTQEAKTNLYRSDKNSTDGCFTFQWTDYGKIRITDFKDGRCNN